jgi:uncharacterized damage-inducible protein DinB
MNAEAIRFLYRYNDWANGRLLAAASALPPEETRRDVGGSFRSVFDTLTHILWVEWRWLNRWLGGGGGSDPLRCPDLSSLSARWVELEQHRAAALGTLTEEGLGRLVSYENPPGTPWSYSVRHVLMHVVNHSTYHRGQVSALIRKLGGAPPATDLLIYIDEYPIGETPGDP